MSTLAWRRLLLGLCAFAFLQLGVCVWMQELHFGSLPGFDVPFFGAAPSSDSVRSELTTTRYVYKLTFPASSPLARTEVRSGDLVDLRAASPTDRYRWASGFWWAGEPFHATISRGGSILHLTVTAGWLPIDWYDAVAIAGGVWMLIFATILAWRRADDGEARVLALLLLLMNIGLNFQSQNWITPWPALDAVLDCISWPISAAGIALLATYAMLFARPPGALRRTLAWASYIVAAAVGVASIPLLPLYVFFTLPEYLFGGVVEHWMLYLDNIAVFIAPLGLTYSLLSRRLLDVGFALNRAAVFAVTSLLLAGLFAGLQWVANAFLTGLSACIILPST